MANPRLVANSVYTLSGPRPDMLKHCRGYSQDAIRTPGDCYLIQCTFLHVLRVDLKRGWEDGRFVRT